MGRTSAARGRKKHGRCSRAVLSCLAALSDAVRKNTSSDPPGDRYTGPLLGDASCHHCADGLDGSVAKGADGLVLEPVVGTDAGGFAGRFDTNASACASVMDGIVASGDEDSVFPTSAFSDCSSVNERIAS